MALSLRGNGPMMLEHKARIPAQSGRAFDVAQGTLLRISDPCGQQVADVTAVAAADRNETFSPGRTIDYNETVALSTGHRLYSNRSRVMFTIVSDDVGVHDVLLSPCSAEMFVILRNTPHHPSCLSNIGMALEAYGVTMDAIHGTFNAFMRVAVGTDGRITIGPPASKAGDEIVLRAELDLVVAVTACSSEFTNNGSCKPIDVVWQ